METLCKRPTSIAHLTNFSFELFYKIFTEDASQLLLYHGAKKSKMTKNSNQGGSCLKFIQNLLNLKVERLAEFFLFKSLGSSYYRKDISKNSLTRINKPSGLLCDVLDFRCRRKMVSYFFPEPITACHRRVARMLRVWRTDHPYADFFFWLMRFLIAHATNTKTQMKKNEPSGLLFTSSLLAKSELEVTPLCREETRCEHRYRARAPSPSTSTQGSGARSAPRGRVTECGAPVRRCIAIMCCACIEKMAPSR